MMIKEDNKYIDQLYYEKLFMNLELRNCNMSLEEYQSYGIRLVCKNDINYHSGNRLIVNSIDFNNIDVDYNNSIRKNIMIIENDKTVDFLDKVNCLNNKLDINQCYVMKKMNNYNNDFKKDIHLIFEKSDENIRLFLETEKANQFREHKEVFKENVLKDVISNDNTYICMAKYQEDIVGVFYYFKDINVIESVYCHEDYRKLGIMRYAITSFCEYHQVSPYLFCESDNIRFYQKCGFELVGVLEQYDGLDNDELYQLILSEMNK